MHSLWEGLALMPTYSRLCRSEGDAYFLLAKNSQAPR